MATQGRPRRITRALFSFNPTAEESVVPVGLEPGQNAGIRPASEGLALSHQSIPTTKALKKSAQIAANAKGVPEVVTRDIVDAAVMEQGRVTSNSAKKAGGSSKRKAKLAAVPTVPVAPLAGYSEIVYKPSDAANKRSVLIALAAPSLRQKEKVALVGALKGKAAVRESDKRKDSTPARKGGHKYMLMDALSVPNGKESQLVVGEFEGQTVGTAMLKDRKGNKQEDVTVRNKARHKSVKRGRGRGVKGGSMEKLQIGRRAEDSGMDNLARILRRVKHQLQRIRKEEFFVDVYHADGWKGSSKEKVRPEFELKRAQKQVLHSKLAIREAMRELDILTQQGAISEGAFDKEGRITHGQIFCARCQSKVITPDNDIILCDGYCNRAFHQRCLNPPLKTEHIPPGDEGWLCPECDCKVECVYAIQSDTNTPLGPTTTWEDIFPEVAEPCLQEGEQGEGLVAEADVDVEWPSDESEDEDYIPLMTDVALEARSRDGDKAGETEDDEEDSDLDTDESDTSGEDSSDEEELNEEILERLKKEGRRRSRVSTVGADAHEPEGDIGEQKFPEVAGVAAEEGFVDLTLDENEPAVSGKRRRTAVDYRKLHDEMFGAQWDEGAHMEEPGSEDEDWGPRAPKRRKKAGNGFYTSGSGPNKSELHQLKLATTDVASEAVASDVLAAGAPTSCSPPDMDRRTGRSRLPEAAKEVLRTAYAKARGVPKKKERDELALLTGLGARQVETWYRNFQHKHKDAAAQLVAQASGQPAEAGQKCLPALQPPPAVASSVEGLPLSGHDTGHDSRRRKRSTRIGEGKADPLTSPSTAPLEHVDGKMTEAKYLSRASARLRGCEAGVVVPASLLKVYPLRTTAGRSGTMSPGSWIGSMGPNGGSPKATEPVQALLGAVKSRLKQLKSTLQ